MAEPSFAQSATIRGFVTDASDGRALAGATVALFESDEEDELGLPTYGAVTTADGLYLISRVQPGSYRVRISFVGYAPYEEQLTLESGDVLSVTVALEPSPEALDEVLVETERTTGMARVTAGHQRIRPEDVALIPSPDVSADLAGYLSTLPGIVTTGDQGGQFFVRGGEPSQNLVMLDGMLVYQPFHLLGFYSVFPAEVIDRVDFYAGGFGGQYGTRLSSVIDVSTRTGNNRRFAGMASLSPFTGSARLEGPLVPGRFSFLVTGRESLIEHGAARYVSKDLPFRFGDAYAKVHGSITPTSQASVTALRTHDRGTIGEDTGGITPEEINWSNEAIGLRLQKMPRALPVVAVLYVSHSRMQSELGPSGEAVRSSTIRTTRVALNGTFVASRHQVRAGWEVHVNRLESELGGLYQNVEDRRPRGTPSALYVEPDFEALPGLRIQPGLRGQFYNVRFDPYLEPRIRAVWERNRYELSAALGLYHQELVGIADRRDAASVYTVWTAIPRAGRREDPLGGRIGRAFHGMAGIRSSPAPWLEISVEGFYKHMANLFVAEWTAEPRLNTQLNPARGRSIGADARIELRRGRVYAFVNYGLSSTIYSSRSTAVALWYDASDRLRYSPPHDRRHQVNALISVFVAGFDFSARWEFGSGMPYTQPLGYDGFLALDNVHDVFRIPGTRRVIYERPFRSRLPTYHRLDLSLERTFRLPNATLTIQGSVINAYDRRNLFYVDTFTDRRVDQLPIIPSFGLKVSTP